MKLLSHRMALNGARQLYLQIDDNGPRPAGNIKQDDDDDDDVLGFHGWRPAVYAWPFIAASESVYSVNPEKGQQNTAAPTPMKHKIKHKIMNLQTQKGGCCVQDNTLTSSNTNRVWQLHESTANAADFCVFN